MRQPQTETKSVKRLAIIAPDAMSVLRQRGEVLAEIMARRHSVLVLVPEASAAAIPALEERGFSAATFPMASADPQMFADGKTANAIAASLVDWRAHVLLASGAKPMLLGAMAAKKAGVGRRVGLVTQLPGPMIAAPDAALSWGWRRLLKTGFKAMDAVVWHNEGQSRRLQTLGVLPAGLSQTLVPGAGVDLVANEPRPLPPMVLDGVPALNFLMIARQDATSGAVEFCKAARLVRETAPQTRFILAGPAGGLTGAVLPRYADCVQVLGDQADVRPLIAAAHVVVAPSWGDGPPRVLLEALAAGRPVITSDIPGCREAVDERVNGVLVPPRDAAALAEAMMSFLKRPDLIPAMARASRAKAERRFDVRVVDATVLGTLGL